MSLAQPPFFHKFRMLLQGLKSLSADLIALQFIIGLFIEDFQGGVRGWIKRGRFSGGFAVVNQGIHPDSSCQCSAATATQPESPGKSGYQHHLLGSSPHFPDHLRSAAQGFIGQILPLQSQSLNGSFQGLWCPLSGQLEAVYKFAGEHET
jgi:hypothetical protein